MDINDLMKQPYGVLGIMGMRGSGKTYLSARLKMPEHVKHIYYIDVVGAFRKELPNVEFVEFDVKATKEAIIKVLDKAAGANIRELILDVSNLRREDLVDAVNMVCEYLMWRERPCAIIVDEAGDVLEQEHVFYAEDLERAVRIGRNKGILFVVLITQRPQKVNKHAFTLSDQYAIFKFVHNLDLEAVRAILGYSSKEFETMALRLKGQGIGEYMLTDGLAVNYVKRRKAVEEIKNEVKEEEKHEIKRNADGDRGGYGGHKSEGNNGITEGNKQASGVPDETKRKRGRPRKYPKPNEDNKREVGGTGKRTTSSSRSADGGGRAKLKIGREWTREGARAAALKSWENRRRKA